MLMYNQWMPAAAQPKPYSQPISIARRSVAVRMLWRNSQANASICSGHRSNGANAATLQAPTNTAASNIQRESAVMPEVVGDAVTQCLVVVLGRGHFRQFFYQQYMRLTGVGTQNLDMQATEVEGVA